MTLRTLRCAATIVLIATGLVSCTSAHPNAHVRLHVSPARALFDAPVTITASGFAPHAVVTISTVSYDLNHVKWSSSAHFVAAGNGTVTTAQASTGGSYTGTDSMGIFQDEVPHGAGTLPTAYYMPDTWTIDVSIATSNHVVASTTITRLMPDQTGVTTTALRPSKDHGLYGLFARPASATGRGPAVLLFGGSEGGMSEAGTAELLAARGFPALTVAYFAEPGLPQHLERIPIEYFGTALRWLAAQPGVDPRRMAVWGASRGSEAALLTGVHYPNLVHGVVATSPSDIVFSGLPVVGESAWTWAGKDVPYSDGLDFFSIKPDDPSTLIPVNKINGPIFAVCGTADEIWGSCAHMQSISDVLATAHSRYRPTLLRYVEAGHFVCSLVPDVPFTATSGRTADGTLTESGGTAAATEKGSTEGWEQLLAFLHRIPD